jgi:hypothetical protein
MYFFTDRPAQTILLNPFHYTATKSPFTLLEITMGQDKIYGWSAQFLWEIAVVQPFSPLSFSDYFLFFI